MTKPQIIDKVFKDAKVNLTSTWLSYAIELCDKCMTEYDRSESQAKDKRIGELEKENRELKEHLSDMKGFFADNNSPL